MKQLPGRSTTWSTYRSQAGFTMIELLIVIMIIGVLAVIGINNFTATQIKARDAERKSDLQTVAKALEMYFNDKGRYPIATNGEVDLAPWGNEGGFTDLAVAGGAIYLTKMPADPGAYKYYYSTDALGTYFKLYARLENTKDGAVPVDGDDNPTTYADTDCESVECNYSLTSTNTTP